MRIGIGLPTFHGNLARADVVLDWARRADEAGFDSLVVHDKPNHDTWDPLATLAAVAAITRRARLLTAALLLPTRDEALVAKQAAVVDLVSGGRLDLGLAVGARPDDFELFGREMRGRGQTFERQLARLVELWGAARETRATGGAAGPAPAQEPHPRLWIGGYTDAAVERAVRFGHGYLFGAPDVEVMAARVPVIRAAAGQAGRGRLPIAGLAYVLPTDDAGELADGEVLLQRYYGTLRKPFPELVIHGSPEEVVAAVRRYEAAGLDVLHLLPVSVSVDVVERLAAVVLPAFAGADA
ncbi:MAG TPA: LLM class flavin-dependent oxidoreductase [Candidatus Limnocylindrales bacterium]|nr:LLM class flavin-dependent oxidoreductase [Candidatus Limnocylindrales bacterium]